MIADKFWKILIAYRGIDECGTDATDERRQEVQQSAFVIRVFKYQRLNIDQDEWEDGRITEAIECVGDGNDWLCTIVECKVPYIEHGSGYHKHQELETCPVPFDGQA